MDLGRRWCSLIGIGVLLVGAATGCADTAEPEASEPRATSSPAPPTSSRSSAVAGYAEQVTGLCRELLAQVLEFDIGNAVTIEEFLGKHVRLVSAIEDFDAQVDAIPVTSADRPAADAFDAYRRFSDAADAKVFAAAQTGDQRQFDAANEAYLALIHGGVPEIDAMHAAGIQCNAR